MTTKFEAQAQKPQDGFGVGMIFFVRETGHPGRAGLNVFIADAEQHLTVTETKEFHKGFGKMIQKAENMNRMGH